MINNRQIYLRTSKGDDELRERARELANGSRRILRLIDGRRTVGDLTPLARPGELEQILEGLLGQGLVELGRVLKAPTEQEVREQERKMREEVLTMQRSMAGMFERELGPDGLVLDARLQDCVNLDVFRRVLRDLIGTLGRRGGEEAASRALEQVRAIYAEHAIPDRR